MKLSVLVTTYKHEKYIAKCIEGILMQKTNFRYEFLIGVEEGDAETIKICEEYQLKYPDKIQIHINPKDNVMYINNRRIGRANFLNVLEKAKGEYVARCDGDDYWIDESKLQKQLDFLLDNQSYSIVGTEVQVVTNGVIEEKGNEPKGRVIEIRNLLEKNCLISSSTVFKKKLLTPKFMDQFKIYTVGDLPIKFECLHNGPGYMFKDRMTAYRKHPGGIWTGAKFLNKKEGIISNLNEINEYYDYQYGDTIDKKINFIRTEILLYMIQNGFSRKEVHNAYSMTSFKTFRNLSFIKIWIKIIISYVFKLVWLKK